MAVRVVARQEVPRSRLSAYFRRMPNHIRSFDVSSGGFSCAFGPGVKDGDSEDGAVEAGEAS